MSIEIELLTCPAGDYEVVLINGEEDNSGHSIPTQYWIDLFKSFGFNAKHREISNEDMQNQIYYKDN